MSGADGVRYRAFLSYCHRDAAFARRLHARLEGYAVPRRLVGRDTPRGPVPARLTPIFRDREELPAADDLSTEVRAALAASGALIVICSPGAAASPWVAREIETFRALHPDRPVLAALAEAEPGEAFPAVLSAAGVEPLAADFRKTGDGTGLGFLKLVSGIIGVGLDELIQRDAQRRLRAVTAVTVGAVAVMLAMGGLAVFAFEARVEADRRRADAEGLVEFMLTDLRGKLKGVGRLDIMDAVNTRVLAHYERQDLRRLRADELQRRADLWMKIGEDHLSKGDPGAALTEFLEARRTTAAQLAVEPNDPERLFSQAQAEFWVAQAQRRSGRLADAESGFRRYAALAQRLLELQPNNPDWLMEASYAESNLGVLRLRDRNDPAGAQRLFKAALTRNRAAVALRPDERDYRWDLADAYAWLADSQRAQGDFAAARTSRQAQIEILQQLLSKDSRDAEVTGALLGAELGLAQVDLESGLPRLAIDRLIPALAQAERLAAADPSNEDNAQRRVVVALTLFKARMADTALSGAVGLLAACQGEPATADQELRDYCALVEARGSGDANRRNAATAYLVRESPRLAKIRRSTRWGIDFSSGLAVALNSQKSGER
jgi:hypothetical protein